MASKKKALPISEKSKNKLALKKIIKSKEGGFAYGIWYLRAALISALIAISVIILQGILPPEIPLYYGLPKGQDQLVSTISLIIPSIVSLLIVLLNFIISLFVKDDFIQKILIFTAFACLFLSTITTIKILFLVGNFF